MATPSLVSAADSAFAALAGGTWPQCRTLAADVASVCHWYRPAFTLPLLPLLAVPASSARPSGARVTRDCGLTRPRLSDICPPGYAAHTPTAIDGPDEDRRPGAPTPTQDQLPDRRPDRTKINFPDRRPDPTEVDLEKLILKIVDLEKLLILKNC